MASSSPSHRSTSSITSTGGTPNGSAMAANNDDSTMSSFVLAGINALRQASSRKHTALRDCCDDITKRIQALPREQQLYDTDADKYFLPFKLACDTQSITLTKISLDYIQKLIAYGYLNGSATVDNNTYPIRTRQAGPPAAAAAAQPPTANNSSDSTSAVPTRQSSEAQPPPAPTASTTIAAIPSSSPYGGRKLIEVIIETLYECSLNRDAGVQLQVIKALLTAVTNISCHVHDQSLLRSITSCYQVYLQAADEVNKRTANATLTQILNLVFQRMEHVAAQLLILDGTKDDSAIAEAMTGASNDNAAADNHVAIATNSKLPVGLIELDSTLEDLTDIRSAPEPNAQHAEPKSASVQPLPAVDDSVDYSEGVGSPVNVVSDVSIATSGEISITLQVDDSTKSASNSKTSSPSKRELLERQDTAMLLNGIYSDTLVPPSPLSGRGPAGKRGWCVECRSIASYYCVETRDAVCSVECMQQNLQHARDGVLPTALQSLPASSYTSKLHEFDVRTRILSKLVILQTDAWKSLRALCRLAGKTLPKPADPTAIEGKLLSLQLLLNVLQNAPNCPTFRSHPYFVSLIRTDLVNCLISNSGSEIEQVYTLSTHIFLALCRTFKEHLYGVIGPFIDGICLPTFHSPNFTYEHKYTSLQLIKHLCEDSQMCVDLFLNYDCDMQSPFKTFEQISKSLERMAKGNFGHSDSWLTPEEAHKLQIMALQSLVALMETMVNWTNRAKPLQQPAALDDDTNGAAAAASSGDSNTTPTNRSVMHSRNTSRVSLNTASTTQRDDSTEDEPSDNSSQSHRSTLSTSASWSTQFEQQRRTKVLWESGILKFNLNPRRGIKYLFSAGLLEETPEAVATFFQSNTTLDKGAIGEYMGEEHDFNKRVMYAYTDSISFVGMSFDEAFRHYLSGFRLPGEAQKIDRIVEKWAERYVLDNPTVFATADAAFVLGFSVIMLNTDLHSGQIKNRMTKEEFIKNNRGIDNGNSVDPAILSELYDRIQQKEIKLKDDTSKQSNGIDEDDDDTDDGNLPPKKRLSLFQQESHKMVKRTLELIKRGQTTSSLLRMPDGSAVPQSTLPTTDRLFYVSKDTDILAIKLMFEDLWKTTLATFSQLLETSNDAEIVSYCLTGYRYGNRISSAFDMDVSRVAFVTSLKKFTLLGSNTRGMQTKNLEAIRLLLQLAITEGNNLRECWYDVLMCVSEVERLQLIYTSGSKQTVDVFKADNDGTGSQKANQQAGNNSNGTAPSTPSRDTVNAGHLHSIDSATIDKIFTQSQYLDSDAIIDFVESLRRVSEHELNSNPQQPRVFSLQKIVEITYYNMGRIRLVWSNIWKILAAHFNIAGCHPNIQVSMYAIDSLRQLAMRFLERDELTNFAFQQSFFKPFEYIMVHTQSVETKELIIQMIVRMILARAHNIKSGWKGVFNVLSAAAKQSTESLVNSAYDVMTMIMQQYFHTIFDADVSTIGDAVNCLVSFGCNQEFMEVSLKSMTHLQTCANYLGQAQSFEGAENGTGNHVTTELHPIDNHSQQISPNNSSGLQPEPLQQKHSVTVDGHTHQATTATAVVDRDGQARLRAWFLVLTGLSRMAQDIRLDVRTKALTTLFSILHQNGTLFSSDTWRAIFHGVLFPLFDDVMHSTNAHTRLQLQVQQATQQAEKQLRAAGFEPQPHQRQTSVSSQSPLPGNRKTSTPMQSPSLTGSQRGLHRPNSISQHLNSPPSVIGHQNGRAVSRTPSTASLRSLSHHQPHATINVDSGWLQTTCYTALSTLIELFRSYHSRIAFLLPEMLELIASCIDQESEELARIGIKCLTELIHSTGNLFTVNEWNVVIDNLHIITRRTLPQILMSYKLRQLLGLPIDSRAGNSNATTPTATSRSGSYASDMNNADNGAQLEPTTPSITQPGTPLTAPLPSSGPVSLPFVPAVLFSKCRVQLLLIDTIYDILLQYFPQPIASDLSTYTKLHHIYEPVTSHSSRQRNTIEPGSGLSYDYELNAKQSLDSAATAATSNSTDSTRLGDLQLHHLTTDQYFRSLDLLLYSLSFARSFNADLTLRRKLYGAGFNNMEQATRLPQLFYQEARCIRLIVALCFQFYQRGEKVMKLDTDNEEKQQAPQTKQAPNGHHASKTAVADDPAFSAAIDEAQHRLGAISLRVLREYVSKVQAGQLVALESMDEVVCTLLESYATLSPRQFTKHVPAIYRPVVALIEYGSPAIRHSIVQLFGSPHITNLLGIEDDSSALSQPAQLQQ